LFIRWHTHEKRISALIDTVAGSGSRYFPAAKMALALPVLMNAVLRVRLRMHNPPLNSRHAFDITRLAAW